MDSSSQSSDREDVSSPLVRFTQRRTAVKERSKLPVILKSEADEASQDEDEPSRVPELAVSELSSGGSHYSPSLGGQSSEGEGEGDGSEGVDGDSSSSEGDVQPSLSPH